MLRKTPTELNRYYRLQDVLNLHEFTNKRFTDYIQHRCVVILHTEAEFRFKNALSFIYTGGRYTFPVALLVSNIPSKH